MPKYFTKTIIEETSTNNYDFPGAVELVIEFD